MPGSASPGRGCQAARAMPGRGGGGIFIFTEEQLIKTFAANLPVVALPK